MAAQPASLTASEKEDTPTTIHVNDVKRDVIKTDSDAVYPNVYIVGKRGSGKTCVASDFIKYFIKIPDMIVFFSTTVETDPTQKALAKWMEKREVLVEREASIWDIPKLKDLDGEMIFFYDDLGSEIHADPGFMHFLRTSRHSKVCNIIINQTYKGLAPDGRKQVNILILFKGMSREVLKFIFGEHLDGFRWLSLDRWYEIYDESTPDGGFGFVMVDITNRRCYRGFNELYLK